MDRIEKAKDGDVLLSSTGKRQLAFEKTAQAEDFQKLSVRRVLCSPLRRALLTALAAYPDHKILVEPRLREVNCTKGLSIRGLKAWLKKEQPDRFGDVDFSRLPYGAWWGGEEEGAVEDRFQDFLKDLSGSTGATALVGHSLSFQTMRGRRPFPKLWGSSNGWPNNFKPYYSNIRQVAGKFHLVAVATRSAKFVLVRHAHSSAQAARRAKKKLLKGKARRALKSVKLKGFHPSAKLKYTGKVATAGYITKRCKKCNGKTVAQCVGKEFEHFNGTTRKYGISDLKYDLEAARLKIVGARLGA